jgi:hypothetical protein
MKKLLIGLFTLALASVLNAQTVKVVTSTTNPYSVLTNRARISLITIVPAATETINFYDTATTNINPVIGAHYSPTTYTTNYTVTVTNSLGDLQTNSFSGQYTLMSLVAASSNAIPAVASFAGVSNVPSTLYTTINLAAGLAVSGSTGAVVTVTYR